MPSITSRPANNLRAREEFIPRFENAQTVHDYNFAVAEMGTRAHDVHVLVSSAFLRTARATTLVDVQWVENCAMITKIFDPAAAAAGAQVGDIIERVDDNDSATRMSQKGKICRYPLTRNVRSKKRSVFSMETISQLLA